MLCSSYLNIAAPFWSVPQGARKAYSATSRGQARSCRSFGQSMVPEQGWEGSELLGNLPLEIQFAPSFPVGGQRLRKDAALLGLGMLFEHVPQARLVQSQFLG